MTSGNGADDRTDSLEPARFSSASGGFLERLIFNNRDAIVVLCLLVTVVLGFSARKLELNASFESVIPASHPYIRNYLTHRNDLRDRGNSLRVVVETEGQTIVDPAYLRLLQAISDEVMLLPGVERPYLQSLWTRGVRWIAVTEGGLEGGPVMPDTYDGSEESLDQLRANILRSSQVGRLVAGDFKSTAIIAPLLGDEAQSGAGLSYKDLSRRLEDIRGKYEGKGVRIYIVGFAKIMGDLINGLSDIVMFFAIAVVIAMAAMYWFNRCLRSTILVVTCSLLTVVWQLGLLPLLGFRLDPYSILVPFLVFAIGMSHGAQKMNGVMQDIGRGLHRRAAARNTFRRLFMTGFTALVCDAAGFAVLLWVDIAAIRALALIASLGGAILIFTNLILLPVLLTYTGVSPQAAARALAQERDALTGKQQWPWRVLHRFTTRRWAAASILAAIAVAIIGLRAGAHLQIGDLEDGAPELRQSSRYNMDNAYVTSHYLDSSDVLSVMITTPADQCADYETLIKVSDLQERLATVPGVKATRSLADLQRMMSAEFNEGSLKWMEIIPNQKALDSVTAQAPRGLFNEDCNLLALHVHLADHKAMTLRHVVESVDGYAKASDTPDVKFLLAGGKGGIEAATNSVVEAANDKMLYGVYGVVALLCLISFHSWRAVIVAMLPLVLTSILASALMVWLGMGVKVATLPVVALGVGIGVDYALYILSVTLLLLRQGKSLPEAYRQALRFTGRVVMLTGFTLATGVATWAFSAVKFQADMGLLLAFMFLWNMLGALVLIPSLAAFLLPASKEAVSGNPA